MVGVEYILLHAQEPILYIIRKQQRQSPTQGGQCILHLFTTSLFIVHLFLLDNIIEKHTHTYLAFLLSIDVLNGGDQVAVFSSELKYFGI